MAVLNLPEAEQREILIETDPAFTFMIYEIEEIAGAEWFNENV